MSEVKRPFKPHSKGKEPSVFGSKIFLPQLKCMEEDYKSMLSADIKLTDPVGSYGDMEKIISLFHEKLVFTKAEVKGTCQGEILFINHLRDIPVLGGLLMQKPKNTISEALDKGFDETEMETFQEVTNIICGSVARSWRGIPKMDVSVTKVGASRVIEFPLIGDMEEEFLLKGGIVAMQAGVSVPEFGESFFIQLIPENLALTLTGSLTKNPIGDVSIFTGVDIGKKLNEGRVILIVEDITSVRTIVKYLLEEKGYRILEAGDGEDALRILSKERVDLIISDVMMPKMDGFSFLAKVREKEDIKDIPVIMLTALSETKDIVTAKKLGVKDYIVKPFTKQILLGKVQSVFEQSDQNAGASSTEE